MCPGIPQSEPRVCASVPLGSVFPFASGRNMVSENDSLGEWGRGEALHQCLERWGAALVEWPPPAGRVISALLYLHPFFAPSPFLLPPLAMSAE